MKVRMKNPPRSAFKYIPNSVAPKLKPRRGRSALCNIAHITVFGCLAAAQSLEPGRILPLQGATNHVQGIDFDATRVWVTSVEREARKGYLQEFSLQDGKLLRSVDLQDGDRYHPGGLAADASSLWIPIAEYRRESTAIIQRRDKRTLAVEFQFQVADHIGCIAVTGSELIGGNWDSRKFYVWDQRGKLLRVVDNTLDNAYQDLKFESGRLVAAGLLPDRTGAIDWLEYPSFRLIRRLKVGTTDRGAPLTREGMAIRKDELLLLPEDAPSRLFFFRLK
jgi:hypothetical protein